MKSTIKQLERLMDEAVKNGQNFWFEVWKTALSEVHRRRQQRVRMRMHEVASFINGRYFA